MNEGILDPFLSLACALAALALVIYLQVGAADRAAVRVITQRFTYAALAAGALLLAYSLQRDAADHTTWGLEWILGAVAATIWVIALVIARVVGARVAKSKDTR